MRVTLSAAAVLVAVAKLAIAVPAGPAAAERASRPDVQLMHDTMPPGLQRLHEQMMSCPASSGMQSMMSGPSTAGMHSMMSSDAMASPR